MLSIRVMYILALSGQNGRTSHPVIDQDGSMRLLCFFGIHKSNYINRNWRCVYCDRRCSDSHWWEIWR